MKHLKQITRPWVREIIYVLFSFIHNKLLVINCVLTLLRIILFFRSINESTNDAVKTVETFT